MFREKGQPTPEEIRPKKKENWNLVYRKFLELKKFLRCLKIGGIDKTMPDDAMISFPLKDGTQSPEISVKELKALLGIPPNLSKS